MDRVGGEQTGQTSSIKQVAAASFIGTTIEWYDFFLYGTAAALVFGQLFFPYADPLIGTLSSFATFAGAFIARPFGGALFGHYGDRIGRKTMLVITLLMMGIGTFLIGCIPTFESVGSWRRFCSLCCARFRASRSAGSGAAQCSWQSSTRPPVGAASTEVGRR